MGIKDSKPSSSTGEVVQGRFFPMRPPEVTAALNKPGAVALRRKLQAAREHVAEQPYKRTVGDYLIIATAILKETNPVVRMMVQAELAGNEPMPLSHALDDLDKFAGAKRTQDPERAAAAALSFYAIFYGSIDTAH